MGWGVGLVFNCIARLLALLKSRRNSCTHSTRQKDSGTIVAGQMKEPGWASWEVEMDFHWGWLWGRGDCWVDFDIEQWRIGSPGGSTVWPAPLRKARVGGVWKAEGSSQGKAGREAKTALPGDRR